MFVFSTTTVSVNVTTWALRVSSSSLAAVIVSVTTVVERINVGISNLAALGYSCEVALSMEPSSQTKFSGPISRSTSDWPPVMSVRMHVGDSPAHCLYEGLDPVSF
jgi:hypothetical protein